MRHLGPLWLALCRGTAIHNQRGVQVAILNRRVDPNAVPQGTVVNIPLLLAVGLARNLAQRQIHPLAWIRVERSKERRKRATPLIGTWDWGRSNFNLHTYFPSQGPGYLP